MTQSWVAPEACTLPSAEQPLRVAEFDELFITYLVALDRVSATRLQMRLGGPAGLGEQVRDLAARETMCCSFFTFTVDTQHSVEGGEQVLLSVEVPAQRSEVLAALADRADSAKGGVWL